MNRGGSADHGAPPTLHGSRIENHRPILLVSGATATMRVLVGGGSSTTAPYQHNTDHREHLGRLATPRIWSKIADYPASGLPWAADNDCFQGLDAPAYRRLLDRIAAVDRSQFLFVTVPDVVADAEATMRRWREWFGEVDKRGLPAAFVLQDGQAAAQIPWEHLAALFIGGSTSYKLGPDAAAHIREAHRRGKWVHVGRLNTEPRLRYFEQLDIDSFDGSQFSRFPATYIPRWLERLRYRQQGMELF